MIGGMRKSRIEFWGLRTIQAEHMYPGHRDRAWAFPEIAKQFTKEGNGSLRIEVDPIDFSLWNCHIIACEGEIEGFASGKRTIGEAVRYALRDALNVNDNTRTPTDHHMWRLAWESRGLQPPTRENIVQSDSAR